MPYTISRFPGPDSTIEEWRQFIEEAGAKEVFDLTRTLRRTGADDVGFQVLVETAREMVADAGGGRPETGVNDAVVTQVADDLGYSETSRSNFRKLVFGLKRPRNR